MSTVYIAASNKGELVIHLIAPVPVWARQRIWEKVHGVGDLLTGFPGLPTAPVYASGKIGKRYFFVQKKLPGKVAGKRGLTLTRVIDTWVAGKPEILVPQLLALMAKSHSISCTGYGLPTLRHGKLVGKYKSWEEFFKNELPVWLRDIQRADSKEQSRSFPAVAVYVEQFLANVPPAKSGLIHGDVINPANILVRNGKISGIIDWEWAMFGDPAWEFCDPSWQPYLNEKALQPYFKGRGIRTKADKTAFLDRVKAYTPIWYMWGCHVHATEPDSVLYRLLRLMLAKSLRG